MHSFSGSCYDAAVPSGTVALPDVLHARMELRERALQTAMALEHHGRAEDLHQRLRFIQWSLSVHRMRELSAGTGQSYVDIVPCGGLQLPRRLQYVLA